MAGFANIREFATAHEEGRTVVSHCRKLPGAAMVSTGGWWVDLSMGGGNPLTNYYAGSPLTASTLDGTRGIWHGTNKSPQETYLTGMALNTITAGLVGHYKLLDYLLFYPFIDGDSADEQTMDNSVTLPRYTSGEGVYAMLVTTGATTGGGVFTYSYIDSDGNPQTSPTISCSVAASNVASIVTSEPATAAGGNLWLRMAEGTKGIRSITSLTFSVPNGGVCALVLVKPLLDHTILEVNTPHEVNLVREGYRLPRIVDGAYLGLIMKCAATVASSTLTGRFEFAWNSA